MRKVPIPVGCEFHVALGFMNFHVLPWGAIHPSPKKHSRTKFVTKKSSTFQRKDTGRYIFLEDFRFHMFHHILPPMFWVVEIFGFSTQTSQRFQAAGCFHRLIAVDPSNDEWPAQLQVGDGDGTRMCFRGFFVG